MPEPLYTATNCRGAYQLNWTLSVFWRDPIASAPWLDSLKQVTEPDGVRILEHRFSDPGVSQFLLSTTPNAAPRQFVRSVKGRLQYLVRDKRPKAFRRNYGFRSVGSARRMLFQATAKHGRQLSRATVLPDHVHLTVGCDASESPAEVTLGYMNNVAYVLGMKAVFRFGFYVGTFGEYDRAAVSAPRL